MKSMKVVALASPIQVKPKMTEMELEIPKTTSSDPSLWKVSTRKKKKEPTPEPSMEEEEEGSSKDVEELELVKNWNQKRKKESWQLFLLRRPNLRLGVLSVRSPPLSSRPWVPARNL